MRGWGVGGGEGGGGGGEGGGGGKTELNDDWTKRETQGCRV